LLLGSANSINSGRLVPQAVYYLRACAKLRETGALRPGETADFAVPTGNFGDILAGYVAKLSGAPVGRLLCASNANRVLYDFLKTGIYDRRRALRPTLSPSMDILVSGNLERLLYLKSGGDAAKVRLLMESLAQTGRFEAPESLLGSIREDFDAGYATDKETLAAIREAWRERRYLLDPHAATAWAAMKKARETGRTAVVLATASPFKFPRAIFQALEMEQPEGDEALPERLGDALGLPVPAPLLGLWDKPLLRGGVIEKEALARDALERANAWL
jgi:threonine synthase